MEKDMLLLENIPYGNHERHYLDLFIPDKTVCENGIILFIHGGGWTDGDKTVHHSDARFFCERGFVSATMNYRFVTDDITVFDELDDITSALKTIKNECEKQGLRTEKLLLSGGSAGAHLALMYAYTRAHESPLPPVAVCAYCPPFDCTKPDFLMGNAGEFEDWKNIILSMGSGCKITKADFMNKQQQDALFNISPAKYISGDCVPTAIFHGRCDELIPIDHTYEFLHMLEQNGVENDFILYENSSHSLLDDPEAALQAKEMIITYAEKYFNLKS